MDNQNSVCYINKINKIESITGADKIELATVNGWTSIVQKGVHKEGDIILCITTDAVIPEALATGWGVIDYLRKGSRVRTIRLKGVYSEAILIPLSDIPLKMSESLSNFYEGRDMMDRFGIFKYEEPEKVIQLPNGKKFKVRDNTNFHKYYKFPNHKNVPGIFKDGDPVVITRKIHGTNARFGIVKRKKLGVISWFRRFFGNKEVAYEYVYGSHNVQKQADVKGFYATDVWAQIADKYQLKDKLWDIAKISIADGTIGEGIILYGEIYGPGIQGAKYHYDKQDIDIVAIDIEKNGVYLSQEEFERLSPVEVAPVLYKGPWSEGVQHKFSQNQYVGDSDIPHEGIVVACETGDRRKMAKVINPEYHGFAEKHLVPDGH